MCFSFEVRDGDGSVVQFLYGEDGLDVGKTRCLKPEQFPFMVQNYDAFLPQCKAEAILEATDIRKAPLRQSKASRLDRANDDDVNTPIRAYFRFGSGCDVAEVPSSVVARRRRFSTTRRNTCRNSRDY